MLVGIRKEFKNKQGHLGSLCAIPNQKNRCESTFETNLKERRKLSKMLGSSPFKKPHRLGRLKRLAKRTYPSTTKWVLNFSKLRPCVKFFKSLNRRIELNKIHLYFTIFQKFRWTVKFRGKTRPFNVLEWIKVLFSIPSICNFKNKRFFSAGNSSDIGTSAQVVFGQK